MRCTDCEFSQETIPERLRYVYCTKRMTDVKVSNEFESCPYRDNDVMVRLGYKYLGNGTWVKGFRLEQEDTK